jgi:hypothetical protein
VQEISKKPSQAPAEFVKARVVALASGARRSLLAVLVVGTLVLAGWALSRSVPHDGLHLFARSSTAVVRQPAVQTPALPDPPMVQPVNPAAVVAVPPEPLTAKPFHPKSSHSKSSNPVAVREKHHVPDLQIENTLDGGSGLIVFEIQVCREHQRLHKIQAQEALPPHQLPGSFPSERPSRAS